MIAKKLKQRKRDKAGSKVLTHSKHSIFLNLTNVTTFNISG